MGLKALKINIPKEKFANNQNVKSYSHTNLGLYGTDRNENLDNPL